MYVLPVEKAVALGIWSCVSLPSFLPGHPDPRVGRGGAGEHPAQPPSSHVHPHTGHP